MKKTIISLSLITTILVVQSCRENDLYHEEIIETQLDEQVNKMETLKTESDSSFVAGTPTGIDDEITPTDPPPKDKGQWKLRVSN